ncbi:MAG: NUDIX domain-containing protein [Alphaproteobacteria bacterium]|nr:NUDIX domain-containing protein [Alphaproteobacteria bacterium]
MKTIDFINTYVPYDEAEKASVEAIRTFVEKFKENIYCRSNILGHACGSAWIVNKERTKVLMAHHNIYKSYNWIGGHADGETNLLNVALRETEEETGLKNIKTLNDGNPFDINMEFVIPHVRKGESINAHLHLTFVFLFEADENEKLIINEEENSALTWIDVEKVLDFADNHMYPIYARIIEKVKKIKEH